MTCGRDCERPAGSRSSRGSAGIAAPIPDYLADLVDYWRRALRLARPRDADCCPCRGSAPARPTPLSDRFSRRLPGMRRPSCCCTVGRTRSSVSTGFCRCSTDVNVVVPCLPGYPYATRSPDPACRRARTAEAVAVAMAELGHERYVVSGGDIGSSVAEQLAAAHPDRVSALHLTDIPYTHLFTVDPTDLTPAETRVSERRAGLAVRRGRVRAGAGDQAAHAGRRPGRFPGRAGGLDRGEAAQLE